MHVRRNFLNWGAFLICLGAVPLAVQLGALDRAAAGELLRLWPLILVGIGVGLLLRFTPLDAVGVVLSAGTFGVLVGAVLAGGFPGVAAACSDADTGAAHATRVGTFAGGAATARFDITCAKLDVNRIAGGAWSVDVVGGSDGTTIEGDTSSLRLNSAGGARFGLFGGDPPQQWLVTLPAEQALSVDMTLNAASGSVSLGNGPLPNVNATFNASDARLDLSGVTLGTPTVFDATLNASSIRLILPSSQASGDLTLNAASLELCVPESSGLQITYENTLSSHNFAAIGLVPSGVTWRSTGYDGAATKIDLRVTANVSSITLSRSGGCQ